MSENPLTKTDTPNNAMHEAEDEMERVIFTLLDDATRPGGQR